MKNKDFTKELNILRNVFPVILMALVLIIDAWFLFAKGAAYLDGDMASEVVKAKTLSEDGKLFFTNGWLYGSSNGFLSLSNVYRIGLVIFKNNWVYARALGVMILIIILAAAYYYVAYMVTGGRNTSLTFAAISVCPMGYWYLHYVTFGGLFISRNIMILLLMIAVLSILKGNEGYTKKEYICYALIAVIMLFMGIGGVEFAIYAMIPLVLSGLFIIVKKILDDAESLKDYKCCEYKLFFTSVVALVFYIAGAAVKSKVVSRGISLVPKDEVRWGEFNFSSLMNGVFDFLSLFGYQYDEQLTKPWSDLGKIMVFSIQGIATCFGLLVAAFLVFSVVRLVIRYRELSAVQQFSLVMFLSSVIVCCIAFRLSVDYCVGAQYWIPVVVLGLLMMQMELCTEQMVLKATKPTITVAIALSLLITGGSTILQYQKVPYHANIQLKDLAKVMVEAGYKEGYATYWDANTLTVLTSGQIDTWTVWDFSALTPAEKLQKNTHMSAPTSEKIFSVIGPQVEMDRSVFLAYMDRTPGEPVVIYQEDGGYIVVEYFK